MNVYNGFPASGWIGQTYLAPGGQAAARGIRAHYGQVTPEDINRYGVSPDQGELDMLRATGQSVLANNYFQTPGYQLLFGSGAAQLDPTLSPAERYEASPGYQYLMDESLRQLQRGSAAQGLLESGSTQRDLLRTAQGLAQQDYGNWWNRLSGNYENYQNRLANLASAGMQNTGNQMAFGLGQGQAQGTLGTGANISSLLSNQGMAGLGAYTNTGAAMANNVMQGAASKGGGGGLGDIMGMAGSLLGGGGGGGGGIGGLLGGLF